MRNGSRVSTGLVRSAELKLMKNFCPIEAHPGEPRGALP
jgi:hypothetical protein